MSNIYFMCENCGIETNGITFVNGMKFCAKCYHQIFGKDNQQTEITQLKQQLAEKDCRIEELEGQFAYECECNKQLVDLQKQLEEKQNMIDEINKEFVQAVHDWKTLCAEKDKEIKKLNWQLKDKDFIIKNLNHSLSVAPNANAGQRARIDELTKIVKEKDKEIESLKKADNIWLDSYQNELDTLRQNQTQLAIHELEKVKTLIQNAINFENPNFVEVYDAINKQINDLRGEKDATS